MHRDDKALSGRGTARAGQDGRADVSARVRWTACALLTVYLAVVGWLILRPVSATWVEPPNLRLSATIRAELAEGPVSALPTLGGGLLILAPLGVLLPILGRKLGGSRFVSLTRTTFAGSMIALGCEVLRSAAPSQVADVDHVLLATVGIALTHLCTYSKLRRLRHDAAPQRAPRSAPSTTALGQEPIPQGVSTGRHRVGLHYQKDTYRRPLSVR